MARSARWAVFSIVAGCAVAASSARGADPSQVAERFQQVDKLLKAGDYQTAEPLARQMLEMAKQAPQMQQASLERCREKLAECCRGLGRYEEAEQLYQAAAAVWTQNRSQYDVFLAANAYAQAGLCMIPGRHKDAESLHTQALRLRQGLPSGPDRDLAIADSQQSLAELHRTVGRYAEAESRLQAALDMGPEHRGEGVWALSRGFLVAGTRRVVATNWLVDDEAGAELVRHFCGEIAEARGKGRSPDYAQALQTAKRRVRGDAAHTHWKNPSFWGPFVLLGPR